MILATRGSLLRQLQCHLRKPIVTHQLAFARLLSSLAILEQREGRLNHSSLSAVTAAQKLGDSITGFIAGSGAKSVAQDAAKVKGLKRIIAVENASYDKVILTLI